MEPPWGRKRAAFQPHRWRWGLLASVLAALASTPAHAQNAVQWKTNYYQVSGTSMREIRQSIRESRPWKDQTNMDGRTDWQVRWRYSTKSDGSNCRCATFSTTTVITTTLPLWRPAEDASQRLKDEWTRFIKPLATHELGHADLAKAAANTMHARVRGLGPAPDCRQVGQRVNALAERALAEFRQKEKDFDRRTDHGRRP